jgi:hypothetical protein
MLGWPQTTMLHPALVKLYGITALLNGPQAAGTQHETDSLDERVDDRIQDARQQRSELRQLLEHGP